VIALLLAAALAAQGTPASPPRPAPAGPPGLRSDKPVRVDAEEVRFSWKTRQVTVVGKPFVTLVHDDATLTCRKLTGENDQAGQLRVAICEGDVRLERGQRTVTCERATYDRPAGRVVCTGNPVLRDPGGTEARATTLTWDLGADEVRLEGAAQVTVPGGQLDLGKSALKPGQAPPAPQPAGPAPAQPSTPEGVK
jgi:lipopolysaccharide export system protein LptA